MTDKELIRKVHSGNKEALHLIIDQYYDEIYRFCFYLTGHEADSYDITQEVFLKFIRYVDLYQNKNLKGYLLIIARNLCYDHFRRRKNVIGMEEIEELICRERQTDETGIVEDRLLLSEALLKIPTEQREVIILRIYEELKFMEIAKMTGCSISTVKSRYRLGIKRLKKIMEEESEG